MTPTLPSTFGKKCWVVAMLAAIWAVQPLAGCHRDPPPVAPGEPIPPPGEIQVDTMDQECTHLVHALLAFGDCPNHDEDAKGWATKVAELAEQSFEAGKKGKPDAPSQHVIALACHKATVSVTHATERCKAGPAPKGDY